MIINKFNSRIRTLVSGKRIPQAIDELRKTLKDKELKAKVEEVSKNYDALQDKIYDRDIEEAEANIETNKINLELLKITGQIKSHKQLKFFRARKLAASAIMNLHHSKRPNMKTAIVILLIIILIAVMYFLIATNTI